MSVGTRTETGRPARRVHDAERVRSGAAQRAYARRRQRAAGPSDTAPAVAARSELAGRGPFVAAILAMFGCGLALTLVLTTRAAEDSYQLSDAREANRVLSDERAALQREVAAADSAPELAARARELGMIPAEDPARLVVAPDGTVTVVGEPKPAQGPPAPPLNAPPRPGAPGAGADPGERIVPVPALPRTDSAAPNQGNVLAAPSTAPAPVLQGPETAPAPGDQFGARSPVPDAPAPDSVQDPDGSAPANAEVPPPAPPEVVDPAGESAPIEGAAVAPADAPLPADVPANGVPTPVAPPAENGVPAGGPVAADVPAPEVAGVPPAGTPRLPPDTTGEEMR
ncbi:hypothetical protein [Nocardia sp. NBC_00416]|uniref:hypothetical protein n=1 Tax=Nocardia sp. NBC_00416 TaxID=2975991 RepID=UPI002E22579A